MTKAITWDTIRMNTLQKMFISTTDVITENDSNRDYLQAMPGAYNEAVMLLSTTNRYITKILEVESIGDGKTITVDLDSVEDFYQLKPNGIYFTDENNVVYEIYDKDLFGDKYLLLNGSKAGTYQIVYYAYPITATLDTKGDSDTQLDPDVAVLVPLYMASQLYKDDDISIATQYRNEFEIGRELLITERNGSSSGSFKSITGWW